MNGPKPPAKVVGRYAIYGAIASGGMAAVHFGRLLGPVGFSRTVAIKRLHPHFANDPEFVSMFLDEARLAARIRHPHVVPTLDVVAAEGELFLVMEYVPGETLSRLFRALAPRGEIVAPNVAVAIMSGVLQGLHAAHDARNERGEPLGIVHRDVSPQNILVGSDGQARVLDFGVAKAAGRIQTTREGQLKGKLAYMAPEQLGGKPLDRRSDVYSASVVLWEILAGERLYQADNEGALVAAVLEGSPKPPSEALKARGRLPEGPALRALVMLDDVVLRGLEQDPDKRFATAREMALALEECAQPATLAQVGAWVENIASTVLVERAVQVAEIESSSSSGIHAPTAPAELAVAIGSSPSASREAPTLALASSPSNPAPEPPSQLSSVSAVNAVGQARPRSRRLGWLVAALALVVIAAAAMALRSGSDKAAAGEPLERTVAAAVAATALEPSATASSPLAAAPSSSPPAVSAAAPTASAKPKATAPRPRAPAPAATSKACDPPYVWDEQGHKHYKPECL